MKERPGNGGKGALGGRGLRIQTRKLQFHPAEESRVTRDWGACASERVARRVKEGDWGGCGRVRKGRPMATRTDGEERRQEKCAKNNARGNKTWD